MTVTTVVGYSLGHISGAHANPAVTFGLSAWHRLFAYLVGPAVGALAAATLYRKLEK